MGLFNDLKKAAKDIGKIDVSRIANTFEKAIGGTAGSAIKPGAGHESLSGPSPSSQSTNNVSFGNNPTEINVDQMFDQILTHEFSNLELVKNVSPQSVGIAAPHPCRPYSYALLRNGKIAVVIMLTPHNRDRNSAFLNAKKSALDSNVKFLNFYTHFSNERNYVISRIKNVL